LDHYDSFGDNNPEHAQVLKETIERYDPVVFQEKIMDFITELIDTLPEPFLDRVT
jgi:hypothetical protein